MKNPSSLPIRKFLFFCFGMCVVLVAGYSAVGGVPQSLWPILILAGIGCVLIAGLLLLISAQKEVRDALGYIPQTDMDSNQVATIRPPQDAHKKRARAGDANEEDRAA